MIAGTIVLYFYTKILLQAEVEEELYSTEARIESALLKGHKPFSLPPTIEVRQISRLQPEYLKDTLIYDSSQNEVEDFRELSTFKNIKGKNYQITVRNLVVESKDIFLGIVFSYFLIILIAFLFLYYFNTKGNKKLWSPFFENIEQMKQFSIRSEEPVKLIESDILEFSELNTQFSTLTNKVRADYENLKQFTEDVSHEMQTPLAIMQAKIENIINENTINDSQYEQFSSIQRDIQRLKQLNKHLTLLTKIENNQFIRVEVVDISNVMEEIVQNFNELFHNQIQFIEKEHINLNMDPYLADILCNNLISNAVKHSKNNQLIEVTLKNKKLSVSNHGTKTLKNPEKLFIRFYRESHSNQSTGLGLAILKKICALYDFEIEYNFVNEQHVFSVNFKNNFRIPS